MDTKSKSNGVRSFSIRLFILIGIFMLCTSCTVATAKRFDCRLFCKETGFHGMVGGCRCSFTLFTAKRAIRNPKEDLQKLAQQTQYARSDYMDANESYPSASNPSTDDSEKPDIQEYPPKFRFLKFIHGLPQEGMFRTPENLYLKEGQSYEAIAKKRKEMEQDLDNGEDGDFLRLAY